MKYSEFSQSITFLHTPDMAATRRFYAELLGLSLVRDQGTCIIFRVNEGAYLGFCKHIESISTGRKVILTLVDENVDGWYRTLQDRGADILNPPQANPNYEIYHFFLKDPNGYWIEIQRFDQPL